MGYHSPKQMYKSQKKRYCSWLKKKAYCDSSTLIAEDWVEKYLLPKGSDEIWKQLKKEYRRTLD
jgi:hypothetical protein